MSFLPRHQSWLGRLLASPTFYDLGSTLITALAGGGATWGLLLAGKTGWAIVTGVLAALATSLSVVGKLVAVKRETEQQSVHELSGCLETLLAIVNPPTAPDYDKGIRATLHRAGGKTEPFEQVLDYVGDSRAGRTAGRRLPRGAGLIAQVLKDGKAVALSREVNNHEMYVKELMNMGYTESQARDRDMSAMSWMAVPVEHNGEIGGVLFLDSAKPAFFYDPVRQREVIASAVGIAKFAVRRYTQR